MCIGGVPVALGSAAAGASGVPQFASISISTLVAISNNLIFQIGILQVSFLMGSPVIREVPRRLRQQELPD